ncbi:MAG: phospho-N-acetylmuramoyl-pentapeptide-transferase [Ruminococcus sp.]|nr:phospho-N-acetylmuramoyl-pentapeptide-transferase [Ruminococcus sp.]
MPFWINLTVSIASMIIAAVAGIGLVPYLHRLKFGQPIKTEDGPKWHEKKQGTPTMGGIMFIFSTTAAAVIGYCLFRWKCGIDVTDKENSRAALTVLSCLVFSILFAVLGFVDDFIKVSKKHNDGLTAMQKIILQLLFAGAFLGSLYLLGDKSTVIDLAFVKFDLGIFYYPLMFAVIVYLTNAVNLTDGVDGLCGSVTFVAMLVFTVGCAILKFTELSLFTMAVAGGCLGFLLWNFNPAKCFMGDTGSMFLGASVTAVGIVLHKHVFLILVAMVYILEALSVVIQVSYFKYTAKKHFKATGEKGVGKRIFKMTPIHHHFEMSNFSEYKIVITFSLFGLLMGILGIITLI